MQKKISEIINTPYGQDNVSCEPSKQDIQKAIDDKDFETRGFQNPEVEAEYWALNVPERYEWIKNVPCKKDGVSRCKRVAGQDCVKRR